MTRTEGAISPEDREKILGSARDYIESWLDGDAERMGRCLHPALAKRESIEADPSAETMTRDQMIQATSEGHGRKYERPYGTPVSVRFAALPMPDADECELEVTLIKTDGSAVNVATESLTDIMIVEVTPSELSSLFQEEAGTVTLEVETDCSFAATMTMPQS